MSREIATWKKRLETLDHSKGTTNKMIQACMVAEIEQLRSALCRMTNYRNQWKQQAIKQRKQLLEKQ